FATFVVEVHVGEVAGGAPGHPGQPRQENSWGRWHCCAGTRGTTGRGSEPGPGANPAPGAKDLDSEARHGGKTAPRNSHHTGPMRPSPSERNLGTAMGSTLRAELLRFPTWTILSRCHRKHLPKHLPQEQICIGCRHPEML